MSKKSVLIGSVFAALGAGQASLAPHFYFFAAPWFLWFNFTTAPLAVFSIFESRRANLSYLAAVCGGFFLDVYSQKFFGFWMICLLALVAFVKLILKKYVRIPSFW